MKKIFIITGEPSGDKLASTVIAKLEAKKRKKNGWCFTLDFPSYLPLMQFADDRSLRKDIYYAYATKASELGDSTTDNTSNINQILTYKKTLASLLGFSDYASMALKTKMAKSSNEVIKFLESLSSKAKPFAANSFWRPIKKGSSSGSTLFSNNVNM